MPLSFYLRELHYLCQQMATQRSSHPSLPLQSTPPSLNRQLPQPTTNRHREQIRKLHLKTARQLLQHEFTSSRNELFLQDSPSSSGEDHHLLSSSYTVGEPLDEGVVPPKSSYSTFRPYSPSPQHCNNPGVTPPTTIETFRLPSSPTVGRKVVVPSYTLHHCPQCKYQCGNLDNMRKHMRTHSGEKPFHCSFCPYKSAQRCNLYSHIKKNHPEELQRPWMESEKHS